MKISKMIIPSATASNARSVALALVIGVAGLAGSMSATAQTPGLTVSVTPLVSKAAGDDPSITYSYPPAVTTAAYAVSMTTTGNVTNAWFKVATVITGAASAQPAPFSSFPPANCAATSSANTELICQFANITANTPVNFTLLITSPNAPAPVAPAITPAQSSLTLTWTLQAGQGGADSNPSQIVQQSTAATVIKNGATTNVVSYVQVGDQLTVIDNNDTQTRVEAGQPESNASGVTVGVKQEEVSDSCSPHYTKCFESTVTIVNDAGQTISFTSGNPLLIKLIRSSSSLKRGGNIGNAKLSYNDGFNWFPILECTAGLTTAWAIPTGESRCVVPAVKKATSLTYVDSDGNWHFHIIALFNGKIGW